MMHVSIGQRGEIVIPKKIRDYLGLSKGRTLRLSVKGKQLVLAPEQDIITKWRAYADEHGESADSLLMGDELYEEEFRVP